jgi:hypothetical protein
MNRFFNEEKGVVSIVMAIIIPVLVIGVLYVYAMLDKPQQENTAHKIVYASSDAYLSRYNAYLFEQMGILANLDNGGLEPLIKHYLMKNGLIDQPESVSLTINYEQLNSPSIFKEAVNEAATILIGNAFVDYGVSLLDQFAYAEKIKALNQTIQNQEKKLLVQFDKVGTTKYLRQIEACRNVQSGRRALEALTMHIFAQNDAFFKTSEDLFALISSVNTTIEDPHQAMMSFVEAKVTQWCEIEATFINQQQVDMALIALIKLRYEQIESDEATADQLTAQIESEKSKKPMNPDIIDQLIASRAKVEDAISVIYTEIASAVSERLGAEEEQPPSLVELLKQLLLEAEYLLSGIEIGTGSLILDEAYKHSVNDFHEPKWDIATKVKMNEYYLSIFSSYDLNCPRVFDPQNRHSSLRGIKGEAEYLMSGLLKEKQSISFVRLKIVAIRSAANLVTLLSDKDKLTRLSNATVMIPQPWQSITYGAAILAWSGIESYSDINRLMKGEGFYFLKTQTQWAIDFDALFDGSWKNKVKTDAKSTLSDKRQIMDPNMYYLDYLRLLLLIQDEQITLLRAMDLVEAELLGATDGKTSLINFSRGHDIDLTWKAQGILNLFIGEESTIHMRNGFE